MAQIREIVLGFGGFNLNNIPSLVEKYGFETTWDIVRAALDEWFVCEDCGYSFRIAGEAILLPHLKAV